MALLRSCRIRGYGSDKASFLRRLFPECNHGNSTRSGGSLARYLKSALRSWIFFCLERERPVGPLGISSRYR